KHARKIFLEHEISQRASFTRRLITADGAGMRLRHSKRCQNHNLLMQIRQRVVFGTRLNPARRSLLARMQETGHFWTRGKAKSRSTKKTRRSQSIKSASY